MADGSSPYAGTSPVVSLDDVSGVVTLVEGQSFALSGRGGDMAAEQPHGLFVLDTRMLSVWELRLNGDRLAPLAVDLDAPFAATFVGRGRAARGRADADLVVLRERHVGWGMRERLTVTNYGLEPVEVTIEVMCDADFAHLFDVKEHKVRRGQERREQVGPGELRFEADPARGRHPSSGERAPSRRGTTVCVSGATALEPGVAVWQRTLGAGASWRTCIEVVVAVDGSPIEPRFGCRGDDAAAEPVQRMQQWRATVPFVDTDDARFDEALARTGEDLGALRIFDSAHPDLPVLAAGAPWFMTVFGRDSLLTAWMTLLADHTLAQGVLETLARFQGQDVNDATEEEPGRILHEMRFAKAGGPGLDRGDIYYGSIDATPLFVMLLGELARWDPRNELVERLLPHADRALAWIAHFGDRDGDGYVEYQRRSEHGLVNQGWKDSWDSVRHADGELATPPIALCEVQGYVYAAYVARAHFAHEAGDLAVYERCTHLARELRRRFNEDFWLDEQGTYALGLDADKRPIASITSNPGHCLWTGIVDEDKALLVADRLLSRELCSGWGVRTLSTAMPAYNPVSYHNGSVWPHDNAIIAAGLMRYGMVEHAHRIISAQLDVAAAKGGRLPELFAGFDREEVGVPASYPASCSPQAWAAASPLLWLRALLRLEPWARKRQLWLAPTLLDGMERVRVEGVMVGGQRLSIRVEGDDVEVSGLDGYEILTTPRPPSSALI